MSNRFILHAMTLQIKFELKNQLTSGLIRGVTIQKNIDL